MAILPSGDRISPVRVERRALDPADGADGGAAGAVERGKQRPFGMDRDAGRGVVQRRDEAGGASVACPDFEADGALGRRRGKQLRIEIGCYFVLAAEPVKPGNGEQGGVGDAFGQLAQPRVDIAAERHDRQVRPGPQHLRGAAQRG